MLWWYWLGDRKGIRPVKNSGGVVAWLSVWSEMQTCIWPSWCHCHSLSLASVKSRLVLPFWYGLPGSPGQRAIKRMCVRVCVYSVPMPWCTGCRRVGSLVTSVQWECLVSDWAQHVNYSDWLPLVSGAGRFGRFGIAFACMLFAPLNSVIIIIIVYISNLLIIIFINSWDNGV